MASRGLITVRSKADRERAVRWAHGVPFGTTIEFRAPRRSLDQNARMWAMLSEISKQLDWYGERLSAEDYKDLLSASFRKARIVPGVDRGTCVPLGMRTSTMTKAEMGDFMTLIEAFAAEHGVTFEEEENVDPKAI